jgi:ribonuclease HII
MEEEIREGVLGRILFSPVVMGVDEVGRGAWAGPVVACSVGWASSYTPPWQDKLKDSKTLPPSKRESLAYLILEDRSVALSIGWAEVEEIDALNIRRATLLAMQRAVSFHRQILHLYVDGRDTIAGSFPQTAVTHGDALIPQVSAASIVAKVFRDRWMESLHALYPYYRWDRNRGYGTEQHRDALKLYGPTPLHRRSFRPVLFPIPLLDDEGKQKHLYP